MATLQITISAVIFVTALIASGHAVIYKREARAAALWLLVIWLIPAAGSILYLLLGVNRVRRQAVAMRSEMVHHRTTTDETSQKAGRPQIVFGPEDESFRLFSRLVERVTARPLVEGNDIVPLTNGTEAYPAMLQAIEGAKRSIGLSTYIFDGAGGGKHFVDALGEANHRGIEVRVLIDAVGANYSWPPVARRLREQSVSVALFNPRLIPKWLPSLNLRNHRKILVVDGVLGFTGGFNIKREYWSLQADTRPFRDMHFQLTGPVVAHLSETFVNDWQFTTDEPLRGEQWFPVLASSGKMVARGIEAGPDESFERLRWVIIGALNAARRNVCIITPYFLPDTGIISALNAAAMRGVEVDILLPERSNLPYVHWATFGQLWQVLERGCRVWLSPGEFDHSKLMIVDEAWSLFGSANWDARSLRLNFEFNVECYSSEFCQQLLHTTRERILSARPLSLDDVDGRPLAIKLRDGIARLFTPYL
jgi:cardiolipin synthase A/B